MEYCREPEIARMNLTDLYGLFQHYIEESERVMKLREGFAFMCEKSKMKYPDKFHIQLHVDFIMTKDMMRLNESREIINKYIRQRGGVVRENPKVLLALDSLLNN